jgi:hypothetical protein
MTNALIVSGQDPGRRSQVLGITFIEKTCLIPGRAPYGHQQHDSNLSFLLSVSISAISPAAR